MKPLLGSHQTMRNAVEDWESMQRIKLSKEKKVNAYLNLKRFMFEK